MGVQAFPSAPKKSSRVYSALNCGYMNCPPRTCLDARSFAVLKKRQAVSVRRHGFVPVRQPSRSSFISFVAPKLTLVVMRLGIFQVPVGFEALEGALARSLDKRHSPHTTAAQTPEFAERYFVADTPGCGRCVGVLQSSICSHPLKSDL
jgi:hypothetical protein